MRTGVIVYKCYYIVLWLCGINLLFNVFLRQLFFTRVLGIASYESLTDPQKYRNDTLFTNIFTFLNIGLLAGLFLFSLVLLLANGIDLPVNRKLLTVAMVASGLLLFLGLLFSQVSGFLA